VANQEQGREELAIPVIEEELVVDKRPLPTGKVQVRKRLEERTETIDMPLLREEVEIRRVVINKEVDRIPQTREEGDEIIIPVVAEEVVVSKRLVLKEELHLVRHRSVTRSAEEVVIRRERAEVVRLDAGGHPIPQKINEEAPRRSTGRRSRILRED
jgi:uncharacterized protein (TIGR02271 family)